MDLLSIGVVEDHPEPSVIKAVSAVTKPERDTELEKPSDEAASTSPQDRGEEGGQDGDESDKETNGIGHLQTLGYGTEGFWLRNARSQNPSAPISPLPCESERRWGWTTR